MKKTLLFISSVASFLLVSPKATAQNLQTIAIQGGFNADVIANGVGSSSLSTSDDVDGVNFAFISRDFQLSDGDAPLPYGLPENGLITSVVASPAGLVYQLAPYDGNNSLRLAGTNDSGTLQFANPLPAVSLYMLATGGSGDCTVDVTVNFADATSETFSGIFISDWYGGADYAIRGFGRINIANDVLETGGGINPRLYQLPLNISSGNQSKNIESVTVTKISGGIPNIFGFSADAYTSCSGPTNITHSSSGSDDIISWTPPASTPSSGYQYYYSTSSTPPTATTPPTGSVGVGMTTVSLPGLTMGVTYYFWIRSNCGTEQGFWQLKQFTTGQMTTTYTAADIFTEYTNGPELTDVPECAGTLTVNVPAGFRIASTDVSYTMTTASNGWLSEQRTLLVCTTSNTSEDAITSGVGSNTGTYSYNRTGLGIANGLTGAVDFELRAWRTYGGSGCNADYNRVDNNSWNVTVTLIQELSTVDVTAQKVKVYPVPFNDVIHLDSAQEVQTVSFADVTGKLIKTIQQPQQDIYVGDLKSGMYILNMTMEDGSVNHTKAIKN